jgi:hypothetical protein
LLFQVHLLHTLAAEAAEQKEMLVEQVVLEAVVQVLRQQMELLELLTQAVAVAVVTQTIIVVVQAVQV